MSDRRLQRISLSLALAGALVMLAAALASLRTPGLPDRDSSREPAFARPPEAAYAPEPVHARLAPLPASSPAAACRGRRTAV